MKLKMMFCGVLLVAVFIWHAVAEDLAPRPKGGRLIGHGITEGAKEFGAAFALAREAGLEFIELPLAWDSVETAPGRYDSNLLKIANTFFPAWRVKVFLTVNPIDTNNLRIPVDLKNCAFDDPEVIKRYRRLIDYVLDQVPDLDLVAIGIGNEIDAYLANHKARWKQYQTFYEAGRRYIKSIRPELKIGTKAMMYGHIFNHTAALQEMNRYSDLIMVTYYPLKDGFRVHQPSIVHDHFNRLTTIYEGRPISMLEAGYPSSTYIGGSERKQADFIRELFAAWDDHHAQIQHMNFMWLHDVSDDKLKEFEKYYRISARSFVEFLATLGLRTYDGIDKPAFKELKRQAQVRNWDVGPGDQVNRSQNTTAEEAAGEVIIGFSEERSLFQCAPGGSASLRDTGPRPDSVSMRWDFNYGADWQWCLKGADGRMLRNAGGISLWLKSNRNGPFFVRIDESDGESFFVMAHPEKIWKKFEFKLYEFTVDPKTRRNGRLEPQNIVHLILANPPGQIDISRTVWIADFIFK